MKNILTLFFLLLGIIANAQKIKFTANLDEIMLGDSVLLSWKVEGVKKLTEICIKKVKNNLEAEGCVYMKPEISKKYYLQAFTSKKKRKYTKSLSVKVLQPQILDFRTEKKDNTDEDTTTIMWQTANCERVMLNNTINLSKSGYLSCLFKNDTSLNIKAYNKNNKVVEKSIVIPIRKVEYIKGRHNIVLRDTLRVEWKFKSCKKVRIKGVNKDFKPDDYQHFIPQKDTSYTFQIIKNNGDTTVSKFYVKVNSPVENFYLSKFVFKNTKATLKWKVKKGFKVELTGTDKTINRQKGILLVPSNLNNRYTLRVYDKQNNLVFEETKKVHRIISPISLFELPSMAVAGVPVKMYWNVRLPFSVRIEGIGHKLKNNDSTEICPIEDTEYTLIVSNKGKDIDTAKRYVEVIKRREFVKQVKNFSELSKDAKLNFEIFAIDESKYPKQIKLYVMAVDEKGNFVKGLTKQNKHQRKKIIKEIIDISGNKTHKISNFTFEEVQENVSFPYDISMALDYSGSMWGTVDNLEKAVRTFVKNKYKNDKISISKFDHRFMKVSDLKANIDSIMNRFTPNGIDLLGGSTALYAGGDFAMQTLNKSKNNRVLILFTDGMENASMQYYENYAFSATTLAKKAKRSRITVHVVAYGRGVNNSVLQKLAYTTGGNFYKLKFASDINAVFEELPIILKNFYIISYTPISKKGKHSVKMVYDNLQGKDISLQSDYQVGTDFTIEELEPGKEDNYWTKAAKDLNKSPLSVPQAIVFFDFNKIELKDRYTKSIDTYVKFLKSNLNASVIILGHTDTKGTDEYCYNLGERRANTVKQYLIQQGIDENRIFVISYGKDELIWYPENTDWKAKENRRIEFLLVD